MVLIGTYMQKNFVKNHPKHYGMVIVCQQVCENLLKSMKAKQRSCACGKDDVLLQLARWYDLFTMAQMFAEVIDLRAVSHECNRKPVYRIVDENTDAIEMDCLQSSPIVFQQIVHALNEIKLGDDIPTSIEQILLTRSHDEKKKYKRISQIVSENKKLYSIIDVEQVVNELNQANANVGGGT